MTDKYQFSYHLSVKAQSYKCWTLSIKTRVAIIKESAINCVYDASGGTGVGIVYPVGKEQDSLFPPKFCWNLWLMLDDFIKSSAFRSLTRRRSLTVMQIMKQKRDQTLTLLESLFFSRKFIQKTILRKEKKLVLYFYPLIKLLQVLLPTLHIYFISNVHSDEHSAQEGISLLDFNYLILILLAQPLTNIVFLAPLGVKFVLLEH